MITMTAKLLNLALIALMLIAGAEASKNRIINSSDFQKLIENGSKEITLDQYYIKGPINFSQPGGQLDKKFTIRNSTFDGIISGKQMTFLEDVIFVNTSFNQGADFSDAEFIEIADFSRSDFKAFADFSRANFKKDADFSRAKFNGSAEFRDSNFTNVSFASAKFSMGGFRDSKFNGPATYDCSEFRGVASFENAKFFNQLYFRNSHFYSISSFRNASFFGSANFLATHYHAYCNFMYPNFTRNANFISAIFNGPVDFREGKFNGIALFKNTTYDDNANFIHANFAENVDFSGSTFKDSADFINSTFLYNANFADTRFNNANFWGSTFEGDTDFSGSQFNEAFFDGSKFLKNLSLKKAKYDKMFIRIQDVNKLVFDEATYKSLIDNFKKIGFFEDANDCYYRFMVEYGYEKLPGLNQIPKLNNKIKTMQINTEDVSTDPIDNIFLSFYYLFSWILYGFGTKPLYTLIWSLILMIFVFGPFWWHVQRKSSEKKGDEYSWDNYDHKASLKSDINSKFHEIINAIMLSSSIFLSGTKFFIDPPDLPEALEKVTPWVSRVFKLERFFGGILSILFLISIGSVIFSI
jgi:uncharacterized protein YjbI with pentapeptide repeats